MSDGPGTEPREPDVDAPLPERPLPRGCNPLVFGVVMATLEMAVLVWWLYGR